jgi:hypothetical protein
VDAKPEKPDTRPGQPAGPVTTQPNRRAPSDDISELALELFVRFCRTSPADITDRTDIVRRVLDAYADSIR